MLQVRDVTNVWADWCIYGVRYDAHHRHISLVFAYADNGTLHSATQFARATVIQAIEQGSRYCTIYRSVDGKYNFGAMVRVVVINGRKYLTTERDGIEADNLGDLPEY